MTLNNKKHSHLIVFCTASLLLALSIFFTRFLSLVTFNGLIRLDIGQVALELGGYLLGPVYAVLVGLASDLIGTRLRHVTFHYGMTLDYLMISLLPALSVLIFKKKALKLPFLIGTQIIITFGINWLTRSYWLSGLQSVPYKTVLLTRLPAVALSGVVYVFLLYFILGALKKSKLHIMKQFKS